MATLNKSAITTDIGWVHLPNHQDETSTKGMWGDGSSSVTAKASVELNSNGDLLLYVNGGQLAGYPTAYTINGTTVSDGSVIVATDVINFLYSDGSTAHTFTVGSSWISGGSSSGGGGSSGGGIQTLSGGSDPEIINVQFTKLSDSSISISFDWQNISQYFVFTDRGGTVTNTNLSVTGSNGSISGYTGAGSHALTGLNEGDKVWVANATDADGNLPVFTNKILSWSIDKSTTPITVKVEAFFTNNGGNGFGFNADVGLHLSGLNVNNGIEDTQIHSGNLENMSTDFSYDTTYKVLKPDQSQYGDSFRTAKAPLSRVFRNFW